MRRTGRQQRQAPIAQHNRLALLEGDVRRHHASLVIDPRKQHAATLIEPLVGLLISSLLILLVFASSLLRDDQRARMILERLQTVNVIGMIMAGDDIAHRLVGDLPDLLQQGPAKARRAERIEHGDTIRGDDQAGIRRIAFVVLAGNAGVADAVIDRLAGHLIELQRNRQRCIGWRIVGIGLPRAHRQHDCQPRDKDGARHHLMSPQ